MSNIPAIAIHGGADTILPSKNSGAETNYHKALQKALDNGFEILNDGGSAVEGVVAAIRILEDCPLFNAGKGAVFNAKGEHEMDAALMDGRTLKAGAVANILGIKNPILLAEKVLKNTDFVFLAGEEAVDFARNQGLEFKPSSYFFTEHRYDQWKQEREEAKGELGTVGAVAVDAEGNLAAATSTGGITNKKWGRVGDTPIIGAGTYANNKTCAVSCTGAGEFFIRGVASYDVSCLVEYKGLPLEKAASEVINRKMKALGGEGGLIAVDSKGNIALPFNSDGMYRGMKNRHESFTQIH